MAPSQSELTLEDLQRWQEKASPEAARDPEVYFEELMGQFRKAVARSSTASTRYFKIGPYRAKFLFACESLASALTAPFQHLEIDPLESVDLMIGFWDSQASGIPLQPPRWSDLQGSRLTLHGQGHFIQYDFVSEILHAYRSKDRCAVYWMKDAKHGYYSELVCPVRAVFHWMGQESSLQLIHGGAIGDKDGAVILVGKGGSGKSSSCTAALQSELFFLGDDYCLVDTGAPAKVYGLYASTKLNPDMLAMFPHLGDFRITTERSDDKPSFLIYRPYKERLVPERPLKAILMPSVSGRKETRILPASSIHALQALAPSTLFQSTGLGDASFKKMAKLSRALPCFRLEVGTDLDEIPRSIGKLLKSL